MLRPELMQPG